MQKEISFSEMKKEKVVAADRDATALLVIDMMNDFIKEEGKMWLPGGGAIIQNIKAIIDYFKEHKMLVIYIKDYHRKNRYDIELAKRADHCIEGSWGAQVIDELLPDENDLVVFKRRYSGFFQTDLDLLLRENKIKTVVAVGVVTNICVRSTVHDAFFLGYEVIVPRDCVAAVSAREQESSLYDIDTHYGTVIQNIEELKALLKE